MSFPYWPIHPPICQRCDELGEVYIKDDKAYYCAKHAKERADELKKYYLLTRTLR